MTPISSLCLFIKIQDLGEQDKSCTQTHGYGKYVINFDSLYLLRQSRHVTPFDTNCLGKIKHHLDYKYKNAYGALFHLLWLGTECRHATIMFFYFYCSNHINENIILEN